MKREEARLPIFKERFRELQGEMSNTEFAAFLGLSRQTVGFYCNGDRIPDAVGLKEIAEKCNVSADWLLGISEVQSINGELRQICNVTGLTEFNVGWISKCNKEKSKVTQHLNALMEYSGFYYGLNWLRYIDEDKEALNEVLALVLKTIEDKEKLVDFDDVLSDLRTQKDDIFSEIRRTRFEAVDGITTAIKEVSGYDAALLIASEIEELIENEI